MWKFKVFVFLEALLMGAALVTIWSHHVSRVLLFLICFFLILYYYRKAEVNTSWLLSACLAFILLASLNLYVLLGLLLLLFFAFSLFLDQVNAYSHQKSSKKKANLLFGDQESLSKSQSSFSDINSIRIIGGDLIDLKDSVLSPDQNLIHLAKGLGNTRILLPIDMEVQLQVAAVYGQVRFLNQDVTYLRSQGQVFESEAYQRSNRSIKIVISQLAGEVEVIRG